METKNEAYVITEQGWTVRVRPPKDRTKPPGTLLLLHGWTGDESVMWIFTRKLPDHLWMFAPRGPVQAESGFGWLPHEGKLPRLEDFSEIARLLLLAFEDWARGTGAPVDTFDVMGFSQGAAMAFALAAYYPERVSRVLGLAGFAPKPAQTPGLYEGLKGKPVYMAHGTQDTTIPIRLARETVEMLEGVGADVTYCESDVGHKMSADCLRGLETFF